MSNTLNDLNAHLFTQLDRLNDSSLTGEALEAEIKRATALSGISKDIVSNARTQLEAVKLKVEHTGWRPGDMPAALNAPKGS